MYDYIINKFLRGYLNIRSNDEVEERVELPNVIRPFMAKLQQYYKAVDKTRDHEGEDDGEEERNPF